MPFSHRSLRKIGPAKKVPISKGRRCESPTKRMTSPPPKRSRKNDTAKNALKDPPKRKPPSGRSFLRCTVKGCNQEILKPVNLAVHIMSRHTVSKCGKCDESFRGSCKLAWHMKTYHKKGELPNHSFCGSCGKKMTTSYIATHSLRFHDLTPCLDCGDWFEGLSLLEYHLQNCEKGAKRDLCDHLLAKTDGRVKIPSPSDRATVNKSTGVGRVPKGRREVEGRKSNGVISSVDCMQNALRVENLPDGVYFQVAAHFVSQPVPPQRLVEVVGNVELDDTATLKAISDLGIDVPSDDDGGLDGTGTSDPFLNLNLGDFIEDVFSTKPTDKTDVAVEYNVPDMGPLPPLLPSLEPSALGPTLDSGNQFSLDEQADVGSDGSLNTVAQEVIVDVSCEFDTQPFRMVPSNNY